jgi:hypothetical protein
MNMDRSNAIRTLIHFSEGNEGNEEVFETVECSGMREHFVGYSDFPRITRMIQVAPRLRPAIRGPSKPLVPLPRLECRSYSHLHYSVPSVSELRALCDTDRTREVLPVVGCVLVAQLGGVRPLRGKRTTYDSDPAVHTAGD